MKKKKTIGDISVKQCFEIIAAWEAQADTMEDRNAAVDMWKQMAELHVKNEVICKEKYEAALFDYGALSDLTEKDKKGDEVAEWLHKKILCRARAEHCIKKARTAAFTTRLDWARYKVENLEYLIAKIQKPTQMNDNRNGMVLLFNFYNDISQAALPELQAELVEAQAEVAELLPQYQIHKDYCKIQSVA